MTETDHLDASAVELTTISAQLHKTQEAQAASTAEYQKQLQAKDAEIGQLKSKAATTGNLMFTGSIGLGLLGLAVSAALFWLPAMMVAQRFIATASGVLLIAGTVFLHYGHVIAFAGMIIVVGALAAVSAYLAHLAVKAGRSVTTGADHVISTVPYPVGQEIKDRLQNAQIFAGTETIVAAIRGVPPKVKTVPPAVVGCGQRPE